MRRPTAPPTAFAAATTCLLLSLSGAATGQATRGEATTPQRAALLIAAEEGRARGLDLLATGDSEAARPYLEQALDNHQEALGPEHPEVVGGLIHLSAVLRSTGDLQAARAYSDQALASWEEPSPSSDDRTATSLGNLGLLLHAMGDAEGARLFLEGAQAMQRAVLGARHPATLATRRHLALLDSPAGFAPDTTHTPIAPPLRTCTPGSAGCECVGRGSCDPGLSCQWRLCWRGALPHPAPYDRTPEARTDPATVRALIARHLALRPGEHAADIGCGQGSLTLTMARAVGPGGKVYATDIFPQALEQTRAYTSRGDAPVAPVETLLATGRRDTGLEAVPDASIRLMVMINSVHFERSERPEAARRYLRRFLDKLSPGGRLIYHFDWIDPLHRPRAEVEALFVSAGFSPRVEEIPMPAHIPEATYQVSSGPRDHVPRPLRRGFILVFRRSATP